MALKLTVYNEKYSIEQGYFAKDGTWKYDGCTLSKWDKDSHSFRDAEKKTPVKVYLGEKAEAIDKLRAILVELEGQNKDEIPF